MADFLDNLKDNLECIGKTITEKAEMVSKKAEDVVEITKIKNQIRTMERNNERDLRDMGRMIYEQFKQGKLVDTEFVELCEAIAEREEAIDAHNKQVADIKGKNVCGNCKEHLAADAVYCPKCGTKIEKEAAESVVEDIVEKVVKEAFEAGE